MAGGGHLSPPLNNHGRFDRFSTDLIRAVLARATYLSQGKLRCVSRLFREVMSDDELRKERKRSEWSERVVFCIGSRPEAREVAREVTRNRLAMLVEDRWFEMASMQTSLGLHISAEYNGTLVVAGGNVPLPDDTREFVRDVQIFKPTRNQWEIKEAQVPDLFENCRVSGFVEPSTIIVLGFGARNEGIQIALYDWDEDAWTLVRLVGQPELCFGAANIVHGTNFYNIGGIPDSTRIPTNAVRCLDVRKREWKHVAPMPEARVHACTIVIGDEIYVAGGISRSESNEDTTETPPPILERSLFVFNTQSGEWRRAEDMPEDGPSGPCTIGMAANNNFLVYKPGENDSRLAHYDTQRMAWTLIPETDETLRRLRRETAISSLPIFSLL